MSRARAGSVDASASGPPAANASAAAARSRTTHQVDHWWARGLLFESCNCQVVCPGHVHFSQSCTHERCIGYWALRFDEGRYGDTSLDGVRAVVAFECPQLMIAGDWTEVLLIDEDASADQREAVEAILSGTAGGPWEVLARFVSEWLPTRFVPIEMKDEGKVKRVRVGSLLEASVEDIRGWDRDLPVTFRNMFNQIHDSTQTIARGDTRGDIGGIRLRNEGTHGLHSRFDWRVGNPERS